MMNNWLRRSLLNVPGHDLRKISKAITSQADTVVLDLEDGVPISCKQQARVNITNFLRSQQQGQFGKTELAIRVNSIHSEQFKEDWKHISPLSNSFNSIIFPKVDCEEDVNFIQRLLEGDLRRIFLCIESSKSIFNISDICKAGREAAGLIFGCEDYCADSGVTRTNSRRELDYVRSRIVNSAKANEMVAIDMAECDEGRDFGFTGKQVIHPDQIDTVNQTFSPSSESIQQAMKLVDAFEIHTKDHKGAFDFEGKVIDLPVVLQAKKLLERAKVIQAKK